MTLVGWLESVVIAQAERPAVHHDGALRTYAELWQRAGGFARYLLDDAKAAPGDRIGLVGANEPAYLEAFLGILRAGLVAVPLNPMLDVEALQDQLALVEASGVIVGIADDDIRDGLAEVSRVWSMSKLAATVSPWAGSFPAPLAGSVACIIPTSGSTGRPKGVTHTQGTMLHCALQLATALPFQSGDRSVAFLPFFAAIPEQILPTLCSGGSIEVMAGFDIDRIADACQTATSFDAIPTLMARLLHDAPLDSLRNLRWVGFASEPMPPALLEGWHQALPSVETYQFYGMTELVPATAASHRMLLEDPATVGLPFPTSRLRLADGDSGELLCRSPAQMTGYFRDGPQSEAGLSADGSFRTGDLGRIDERGWVYLTGRLKDLIISGGLNIAPAEIEAVACRHPAISAAAVIGLPDERWGETPVVIGVAKDGTNLTPEALLAHCRQELKGFKRPSAAALVDVLPSTGIGKVAKALLRSQILEGGVHLVRAH